MHRKKRHKTTRAMTHASEQRPTSMAGRGKTFGLRAAHVNWGLESCFDGDSAKVGKWVGSYAFSSPVIKRMIICFDHADPTGDAHGERCQSKAKSRQMTTDSPLMHARVHNPGFLFTRTHAYMRRQKHAHTSQACKIWRPLKSHHHHRSQVS